MLYTIYTVMNVSCTRQRTLDVKCVRAREHTEFSVHACAPLSFALRHTHTQRASSRSFGFLGCALGENGAWSWTEGGGGTGRQEVHHHKNVAQYTGERQRQRGSDNRFSGVVDVNRRTYP